MATNSQIKMIHTLKSKLKLKDEWYRDSLYGCFGVESSKDLTFGQAYEYISLLKKEAMEKGLWKEPGDIQPGPEDREDMATDKQIRMINAMWSEISYYKSRKKRDLALGKLLERIVKVSHINFLLKEDVKKVVNALNAMKKAKLIKGLKKGA